LATLLKCQPRAQARGVRLPQTTHDASKGVQKLV